MRGVPIVKGQILNPKGRGKGTKNAKTLAWEMLGECITTEHTQRFNKLLRESKDDKFLGYFLQVLEYFKPKQLRSINENHNTNENIEITFDLGESLKVKEAEIVE